MRNLKKLLALVLAMMMAFSLMVTANAANPVRDYPDADQADEAFEEAIDVLTGMKVFSGDNGNFKPATNITRAEVAALIYRLATGDVTDAQEGMYAEYGNFPDVRHDAWYAGYVGYCANAGYIKGRSNGNFDPAGNVTGYEALAMILRAIGYDKNGEFTGATWQTEVSSMAQKLGILDNVKTTIYGGTLYLPARRDVVADLLFQADAYVPMVIYTPAFGYQPYGMVNGGSGGNLIGTESQPNPTLGNRIFGLTYSKSNTTKGGDGLGLPVLLGNEQTGESKGTSVMGYSSRAVINDTTKVSATIPATYAAYSAYTWDGTVVYNDGTDNFTAAGNVDYTLKTGIDLIGHKLKLWYDDGTGSASMSNKRVYAYFDKATLHDVVTVVDGTTAQTNATSVYQTSNSASNDGVNLYDAAKAAGFSVSSTTTAVFNNSFGKFGSGTAPSTGVPAMNNAWNVAAEIGCGVATQSAEPIASPVKMYKLISNSDDKSLDAVIALNIESSRITEANTVNRVPTIGVPVMDIGTVPTGATPAQQLETMFITTHTGGGIGSDGMGNSTASVANAVAAGKNVKDVNDVFTGVIAQDALVGNSTKALGDYEFGIHITGTTPRTISANEATAINNYTGTRTDLEQAYFLMNKVEATVTGTVVAYNVNAGTVTLDNGTVLERSDYYHTVVGWSDAQANTNPAPNTAIPQGWVQGATNWQEGYANVAYKFYTDHEGKYLGAERTYGSEFLYGTYQDYSQETSSSSFNYFLTGVTLDGEVKTVQVKKYWAPNGTYPFTVANYGGATSTTLNNIPGTDALGVPFRDTYGVGNGSTNGIGEGVYRGFAITGDTADGIMNDPYKDRNEYLNNMARLGIHNGAYQSDAAGTAETAFNAPIVITNTDITLGAKETVANTSNKYFTEATKFILVSGYGTDSVKATVYDGISDLRGTASTVTLNMNATAASLNDTKLAHIDGAAVVNQMTYYTESPYTYAQSGATAMKVDVIILPEAAVSWSGGSGLYYVGDPNYTLINSWGTDAWKYNLYKDGELEQVWLTNNPSVTTWSAGFGTWAAPVADGTHDETYNLVNDVFLNLKDTGLKANDGQPIYTAGQYDATGKWHPGVYFNNTNGHELMTATGTGTDAVYNSAHRPQLGYMAGVTYSAVTRDAQTATFSGDGTAILERVAGAKVVNLNAKENCIYKPSYGYIWPGITDLTTLNEAGSINPVTGRPLKVSAVVDPTNPLIVTCIYVCYDQTP